MAALSAPAGRGLGTIDQDPVAEDPVGGRHRSVSVAPLLWPTAMHPSDVHETAASELLVAPAGLRVGTIDQEVPFHHSASVAPLLWPTAMHPTVVQDTPASELLVAPAMVSVGWIDQPAASARLELAHIAASVRSVAAIAVPIRLARQRGAQ
jgi:hypothetical protein